MAISTTISISIPVELSIRVESYLAEKRVSRSELARAALISFLNNEEKKENLSDIINEIHRELKEIKESLK